MKITVKGRELSEPTRNGGWDSIRALRQMVASDLPELDATVRDATALVAAELSENVFKYGLPNDPHARVAVTVSTVQVTVTAENTPVTVNEAANAVALVSKIRRHTDPQQLYVQAMKKSLRRYRPDRTEQGFHRIVAVAGFQIQATHVGGQLVIKAWRAVGSAG